MRTAWKFLLAVALAIACVEATTTPASAGNPWVAKYITRADLPTCSATSKAQNRDFVVIDCASAVDCSSGGTATVRMVCDGTSYRTLNWAAVDLSGYLPKTSSSFQVITISGAGNGMKLDADGGFTVGVGAAEWAVIGSEIYLTPVGKINVVSGQTAPTNANDTCVAGDFVPSDSYIFYCTATNTWKRVAIATWP